MIRQRQLPWLASLALLLAACATGTTGSMTALPGATPEGDIAAIVTAANEGEIQQGQAASARATSADVRSFAQMMVADHTSALTAARDTFARAGVNPSDNNISSTLRANSQTTVTNLGTYSGTAFDRTYMQSQVDLHSWLLNALDTALIPSAVTPELRTLLQTQRGAVAMHLDRARTILNGLR
jgi:putative membrane protein